MSKFSELKDEVDRQALAIAGLERAVNELIDLCAMKTGRKPEKFYADWQRESLYRSMPCGSPDGLATKPEWQREPPEKSQPCLVRLDRHVSPEGYGYGFVARSGSLGAGFDAAVMTDGGLRTRWFDTAYQWLPLGHLMEEPCAESTHIPSD